jgi:hypothetical protein
MKTTFMEHGDEAADVLKGPADALKGPTDSEEEVSGQHIPATAGPARTYLDEPAELTHTLFATWITATETTLQAVFEAQSAAIAASLDFLEMAAGCSGALVQGWTEVSQQAAQDALLMNVRVLDTIVCGTWGEQTFPG